MPFIGTRMYSDTFRTKRLTVQGYFHHSSSMLIVAIVFLLAAGQDKILEPEAAALHPVAREPDVIVPVRRLGIGMQADDAGKIARVFLRQGGCFHLRAGSQCLLCQQGDVLLCLSVWLYS